MKKHYVTFGQAHSHVIAGKALHKDVIARFNADSPKEGREKAFDLFGPKFCMEYHDQEWNEDDMMKFFPGGYVDL